MADRRDTASRNGPVGIAPEIRRYYAAGLEAARLGSGVGRLERLRTEQILSRVLPAPPAIVVDVGGGTGVYGLWLARNGYRVVLVDPIAAHVQAALLASAQQPDHPLAGATVGDARHLALRDAQADAVLMLGPLYHLIEAADREVALEEAWRVLRPGAPLVAAGISRMASTIDGLLRNRLEDAAFWQIAADDRASGVHLNPTGDPAYFTTAYFHEPSGLAAEIAAAGFHVDRTIAVEGPMWLLQDFEARWADTLRRDVLLRALEAVEEEPSMLGVSAHLLAIARKPAS
jgi:ubiquinone/menaquinone biosynthesis C-methylase UbiE